MFGSKRIVIAQHERGLLFKDRSFEEILLPGIYRFFDPFNRIDVQICDLNVAEFSHARVNLLVKGLPAKCDHYFERVELSDHEVGLVYKNGVLAAVLPPATRQLYWKGPIAIKATVLDISENFAVPAEIVKLLARPREFELTRQWARYLQVVEIADNHIGLLSIDGKLIESLMPGLYAYWTFNRSINVEQIDLRLQAIEVSGQEILTNDKVSLRINLAATYRITDPIKTRSSVAKYAEFLYRELQFGLRQAIGTRTLDTLLSQKGELDQAVFESIKTKAEQIGIAVHSVGVKDIILPGEMKEILNQVVTAEKVAQANVIKRREETTATRSLLNTAKLMEENPLLLRLKELEVLEKVSEKVERLTVFGGLDGMLKDLVKIG